MWSVGFGSQGTHLLLTQWQRRSGPAAAHIAELKKAWQDGGVQASTSFRSRPEKPPKMYMDLRSAHQQITLLQRKKMAALILFKKKPKRTKTFKDKPEPWCVLKLDF